MKYFFAAATAAVCVLALSGCQTPRQKEFVRIEEGMLKDQVIEAAGNPTRTQRWQGKDRWIYVYYPDEKTVDTKEVHFTDGRVTYIGTPPIPSVAAEEQDRINAESNFAEEQRMAAERAAAQEAKASANEVLSGAEREPTPPADGGGTD